MTDQARHILTGTPARDREIIARLLRTKGVRRHHRDTPLDFTTSAQDRVVNGASIERSSDPLWQTLPPMPQALPVRSTSATSRHVSPEHLPPANPVHVAVALLLARAVGTGFANMEALTAALRAPAPFVLIKAPVKRFETFSPPCWRRA